jgi:hypothetical protein
MGVEGKFYDKEAQRMDYRDGNRLTDYPPSQGFWRNKQF